MRRHLFYFRRERTGAQRLVALPLAVLLGLLQCTPPASACNFTDPGGTSSPPPASPAGGQSPAQHPGADDPTAQADTDPVDLHRGDYILRRQDLFLPGRGLSVDLTFTYRSRSALNVAFGYGWDMAYNRRIRKLDNQNLVLLRGTNRQDEFTFEETTGTYLRPAGIFDTLIENEDGTYTLTSKHGLKESYDVNGLLTRIEDRNGNTLTFSYDPDGLLPISDQSGVIAMEYHLIQITDTIGRTIDLAYDANGRMSAITYEGRTIEYSYDPTDTGDLLSVTMPPTAEFPSGTTTTYSYTDHNLETLTDPKGQAYLSNVYDTEDRVIEQTYGVGTSTIIYDEDSESHPTADVTDRNGFQTLYTFDDEGHIIQLEQFTDGDPPGEPPSYVTTHEYDADGNRTRTLTPRGNAVERSYDDQGNLLELRRKKIGMPPGIADSTDFVTTFTYEPNFNLVKTITDPNGSTTTYTYDYELGELANGNLRVITFPEVDSQPSETTFTYNSFGQIDSVADPNGNVTQHTYNPSTGYLTEISQGFGTPEVATTTLGYDAVGNVTSIINANGDTTSFTYNVLNQLIQVTTPSPLFYETHTTYDANGNLFQVDRQASLSTPGPRPTTGTTSQTDDWQSTVYTYTLLDQLASITDDLGNTTTFTYDKNGNRDTITDAEGRATTYVYDERDLLLRVTDVATPAGITQYAYDENGNLVSITDANDNTTTYTYDDFDRLIRTTYADGSFELYDYDAASNLTRRITPANQVITYDYDELNRLDQKTIPGEITTYTYDAGSRLSQAANPDATLTYTYDVLNRVIHVETQNDGLVPTTVQYGYDPVGNRTQLTYPDGDLLTYAYDELNRLSSLRGSGATEAISFSYDALSRRTDLELLNGTSTTYSYDAINRLTEVKGLSPQGTVPISSAAYTYDQVGNRKTMIDSAGTHTYSYGPLYQLTSVDYPAGFALPDTNYTLDPVGNRMQTVDGGTTAYTSNNLNQYTDVGGTAFSYDFNGNLTSDGANSYTYDSENRLVSASSLRGGAEAISYTYDPLGRRIAKRVDGITTWFLYDGDQVIAETDGAGNITTKYLYGPGIDEPLKGQSPAGTVPEWYYHFDGLGSIVTLTDAAGEVVETYAYDVYGTPFITDADSNILTESAVGNPYLFTGRRFDPETGLYHYRARAYSPELGRFLQREILSPIVGVPETNHRFTYVFNNPLRFVDPGGEVAILAGVAVGIVLVGTAIGAVAGGIEAAKRGESIGHGVVQGSVQGFAGSTAGVITALGTKNPALIGASVGFAAEFSAQGFDHFTTGKSFSAGDLAWRTGIGAFLGPIVSKAIPLRGPAPNLFKPRVLSELLRPNTKRLFERVGLGGLYDFLVNEIFDVPDVEAVEATTHENKK